MTLPRTPRGVLALGTAAASPFGLWLVGAPLGGLLYTVGGAIVAAPFLLAAYAGIAAILWFIPAALGALGLVAAAFVWARGPQSQPRRLVVGSALSMAALVADLAIAGPFHAGS